MLENSARKVGTVEDRLAAIHAIYARAYDETESFEVWPELTAFLLYACGSIAGGGSFPEVLLAESAVLPWLERAFEEGHSLWDYITAVPEPE